MTAVATYDDPIIVGLNFLVRDIYVMCQVFMM